MILDFNSAPPIEANEPQAPPARDALDRDREAVRAALHGQLESVLGYLYPAGFADPKGRKFYVGDVTGAAGESLAVELQGPNTGLWYDYATAEGGDVFDLWAQARGMPSFVETIRDAAEFTGAATTTPVRRPKRRSPKGGEAWGAPSAIYKYHAPDGRLLAQVERYDWEKDGEACKTFRPWDVSQRKYKAPETRPLYNLPNIVSAPEIVLVEGEKAADALIAQNIDATTAMGGSGAPVEKTDWTPLRGRKVVIWPDNDEPGRAYAERVRQYLEDEGGALAVSVLSIPPGRPEKWDAADAEDEDLGSLIRGMRYDVEAPSPGIFEINFWAAVDFASIPRVQYVYNRFYAKGYTSVTAAPPKVGKSLLGLIESVDIATGRGLLTGEPQAPQRVYYYNAEDDIYTLRNRVGAILQYYGIPQEELQGRLSINSGVGEGGFYVISGTEGKIHEAQLEAMERACLDAQVDCIILDPLQDLSRSPETNEIMRLLGGRLRKMANRCQLAIGLIHHTRKMQPGVKASIDDMRGGSALRGTARFNRLLVPMSEEDALRAGLPDHRSHFQVGDIEGNLAPPSSDYARWYEKVSVIAANGESVGVIAPWNWPDAFEGIGLDAAISFRAEIVSNQENARKSDQTAAWAGHLLAPIIGVDSQSKDGRSKIKSILNTWINSKIIDVKMVKDGRQGRTVPLIVPGPNDPRGAA